MSDRARHLYLVIPGIGGSELVDVAGGGDERVWFGGLLSIAKAVVSPDRLDISRPLLPTGLLRDFTVIPLLKAVDGYNALWAAIGRIFNGSVVDAGDPREPNLAATIVAFPYDFRMGVDSAAERLEATLRPRVHKLGERTTIVVVAHSMGGLVARRWASHHDSQHRCRGIVTLGTPFRGAPQALNVLFNGLTWGTRCLERRRLSEVIRAWPGLHSLVPIDERVVDTDGQPVRASALTDGPFQRLTVAAFAEHVETAAWWQDNADRPALVTVGGVGHATYSRAVWDGQRLELSKVPFDNEADGDGTVPEWAAIPPERGGREATTARRRCGDSHGNLTSYAGLADLVMTMNAPDPPALELETATDETTLGFDVETIAEPGDELWGSLRLHGSSLEEHAGTARVRASLRGPHSTHSLAVDVDRGGAFRLLLPPEVEGVVEIRAYVGPPSASWSARERVVVIGAAE